MYGYPIKFYVYKIANVFLADFVDLTSQMGRLVGKLMQSMEFEYIFTAMQQTLEVDSWLTTG